VLGRVDTSSAKKGVGIHRWSAEFPVHKVDTARYLYFVRVTLSRTDPTLNPGLVGVMLSGLCDPSGPTNCPPGPIGPEPPIPS
jgi:hypothetical protein